MFVVLVPAQLEEDQEDQEEALVGVEHLNNKLH